MLTRFYLDRIEKYDHALNTVSEINEEAIKQARALDACKSGRDAILFGLSLLIKDHIDVAGLHTTAGSMAHGMPNGFSSRGGAVKNAYDPKKDPGGSSTGSAVAVSAGFCAMAVGTDTSFSIVACAT